MIGRNEFKWARNFTLRAQAQAGQQWSFEAQEAKMMEELDEFLGAVRLKGPADVCEEFWDTFFANLTLLHLLPGISDGDIMTSFYETVGKLEKRLVEEYFEKKVE